MPALAAALQEFFTRNKPSAPRRPARPRDEPRRRPHLRDRRHRRRAPARERGALPRPRGRLDSRRRGRDRLPRDRRGGRRERRADPQILLVAAYREPIERYMDGLPRGGHSSSSASTSRRSRCCAQSRAPASDGTAPTPAVVAVSVGHERTTLAVSDGGFCQFTRVIEWGGAQLVGRDRARADGARSRGDRAPARAFARAGCRCDRRAARLCAGCCAARAPDARARARLLAPVLPGPARTRCPSPRSCSPAGRAASRGSRQSSSA